MGVHDHRASAVETSLAVQVVTISSTRKLEDDTSGALVVQLLADAGHKVLGRQVVPDDVDAIREIVHRLATDGETAVAVLTGGTGISARDLTPEAVEPLFDRRLDGFGELFRLFSFEQIGAAAMMSRATAGVVGTLVVFALPGSPDACRLGLERLILPELAHIRREVTRQGARPVRRLAEATAQPQQAALTPPPDEPVDVEVEDVEEAPEEPAMVRSEARRGAVGITTEQPPEARPPEADDDEGDEAEGPPPGWQAAVAAVKGEVQVGGWPEVPQAVEKIAPVMDVLNSAGGRGVLTLPDGRTLALFGWPDLEAPGAKVLAVGQGEVLAEVVALHRHPVPTGTCVENPALGVPGRWSGVEKVAEDVLKRAPGDPSGQLFAVQADAVWIQRGSRAVRFDGKAERDDGTLKQVLASLVLHWSRR